jgi:hypothetical protein
MSIYIYIYIYIYIIHTYILITCDDLFRCFVQPRGADLAASRGKHTCVAFGSIPMCVSHSRSSSNVKEGEKLLVHMHRAHVEFVS